MPPHPPRPLPPAYDPFHPAHPTHNRQLSRARLPSRARSVTISALVRLPARSFMPWHNFFARLVRCACHPAVRARGPFMPRVGSLFRPLAPHHTLSNTSFGARAELRWGGQALERRTSDCVVLPIDLPPPPLSELHTFLPMILPPPPAPARPPRPHLLFATVQRLTHSSPFRFPSRASPRPLPSFHFSPL